MTRLEDMSIVQIEDHLRRMKAEASKKVKRPAKPAKPKAPERLLRESRTVMEINSGERVTLSDILDKLPEYVGVDDAYIDFEGDSWGDYTYFRIGYDVEIENPKYDVQHAAFEKKFQAYEERMVRYEKELAEWKASRGE